ncbi:hypothetical protein AAZX31_17G191900 [Glycine max]
MRGKISDMFWCRNTFDFSCQKKGCVIVSYCSLCLSNGENIAHLFLECPFAQDLDLSSFQALLKSLNRQCGSQMLDVCVAAVIFCLWGIWHCRNQVRFRNVNLKPVSMFSKIAANRKFIKAPNIIEACWYQPLPNWVKCNVDGVAKAQGMRLLVVSSEAQMPLQWVVFPFTLVFTMFFCWTRIWLESYSRLVVDAILIQVSIPWKLQNREGNRCADSFSLANHPVHSHSSCWWDTIPICVGIFLS